MNLIPKTKLALATLLVFALSSKLAASFRFRSTNGNVKNGDTIFLLTTLRSFGRDGLEAALRSLGRVDEVTLVPGSSRRDEWRHRWARLRALRCVARELSRPGRYSHSQVEVLDLRDLQVLERLIYAIATAQ